MPRMCRGNVERQETSRGLPLSSLIPLFAVVMHAAHILVGRRRGQGRFEMRRQSAALGSTLPRLTAETEPSAACV